MEAAEIMNLRENDTTVILTYRIRSCVLGFYHKGVQDLGQLQECSAHVCHLLLYIVSSFSVVTWKTFDLSNNFPFLRKFHKFCEERGVRFLLLIVGFTVAVIP